MAKRYEELTFTDDFMFCKILEQDTQLCVELLELTLDRKVGRLVTVNRQKPVEITANGKGVRFDVYAEDGKTVYDIEMQNAEVDFLPKRARYSQSMIDLNLMERGMAYRDLNPSFVIYICKFRLFPEMNRYKYTFRNLCVEDASIELGDETAKIFLCTDGDEDTISDNLKAFLAYIADGKVGDDFTNRIENAVIEAKEHKRWRQEYMTLLEHYERERMEGLKAGREEGRKEGLEEGRKEGLEEGRKEGLEEGRKEGLEEGRKEGECKKLIRQVRRKTEKGMTPERIASDLEEELPLVQLIYDAILADRDADDEAVYKSLSSIPVTIQEECNMLFVCYPRCSTCRKAKKWLDEHGLVYEVRDIKEQNPTEEELRAWQEKSGLPVKRFFNTSGMLYREMHLKDRLAEMSDEEMLRLLATDGMLVKRPILVSEDKVLVGFREAEWEQM